MQSLLIASVPFSTRAAETRSPPVAQPSATSATRGATSEISAEEIYQRFGKGSVEILVIDYAEKPEGN